MSGIYLKQEIIPESNNQETRVYCDDPLCVNREGCLLAEGAKGTLIPNYFLKSRKYKCAWICESYLAPEPKIGDIIDEHSKTGEERMKEILLEECEKIVEKPANEFTITYGFANEDDTRTTVLLTQSEIPSDNEILEAIGKHDLWYVADKKTSPIGINISQALNPENME